VPGVCFPDDSYEGETFTGLGGDHVQSSAVEFSRCVFRRCSFQYAQFLGCALERCEFLGCNLTLVNLEDSRLLDTAFTDCKLSGVNWSNPGGVFRAAFTGCILDDCSFASLNLARYVFDNCSLRNASFADTKLAQAKFIQCDLRGCSFLNTDLSHADFSTAFNYFVDAGVNRLHKTVFSLPEAAALLGNFDITLK